MLFLTKTIACKKCQLLQMFCQLSKMLFFQVLTSFVVRTGVNEACFLLFLILHSSGRETNECIIPFGNSAFIFVAFGNSAFTFLHSLLRRGENNY